MIFVKTLMNTIQNDYPIRLVKKTYSKKLILIVTELCIRGGKLNLLKIAKTLTIVPYATNSSFTYNSNFTCTMAINNSQTCGDI